MTGAALVVGRPGGDHDPRARAARDPVGMTCLIDVTDGIEDADLARHQMVLHVSADADGRPRVLTTNFDTLFERAHTGLPSHATRRTPMASVSTFINTSKSVLPR